LQIHDRVAVEQLDQVEDAVEVERPIRLTELRRDDRFRLLDFRCLIATARFATFAIARATFQLALTCRFARATFRLAIPLSFARGFATRATVTRRPGFRLAIGIRTTYVGATTFRSASFRLAILRASSFRATIAGAAAFRSTGVRPTPLRATSFWSATFGLATLRATRLGTTIAGTTDSWATALRSASFGAATFRSASFRPTTLRTTTLRTTLSHQRSLEFHRTTAEVSVEISWIETSAMFAAMHFRAAVVIAVTRCVMPIGITSVRTMVTMRTMKTVVAASEVGPAVMCMSMMGAGVFLISTFRRDAAATSAVAILADAVMCIRSAVEVRRGEEAGAGVMLRTVEVRATELPLEAMPLRTAPLEAVKAMSLRPSAVHGVMTMIEHPLELIPAATSDVGLLRAGLRASWPFVIRSLSFRRAFRVVRRSRAVFVHGMVLAHHFGAARIEARLEVGPRARLEVRFVAGLELRLARFLRLRLLLLQQLLHALQLSANRLQLGFEFLNPFVGAVGGANRRGRKACCSGKHESQHDQR